MSKRQTKILRSIKKKFAFALSGLGIFPGQQTEILNKYGFDIKDTELRRPSQRYYPYTLPWSLFQLLRNIMLLEDKSRRKYHNLLRRARILSLLWHSKRQAIAWGVEGGKFAYRYIEIHAHATRPKVAADLKLMEQYDLIRISNHGGGKGVSYQIPSQWELNDSIPRRNQRILPLIPVSPPFNSVFRNFEEYNINNLTEKLYAKQLTKIFLRDIWKRRQESANEAKASKRSIGKKDKAFLIVPGAEERLKRKLKLMETNIERLNIEVLSKDYLLRIIAYFDEIINSGYDPSFGDHDTEWYKLEKKLAEELLRHGIISNLGFCASGRTKTARGKEGRSGNMGSVLSTSKKPGKRGYLSLWCALTDMSLTEIDIKSADPLALAITTRDSGLFNDLIEGDLYETAIRRCSLPDQFQDRKKLKNELFLPIIYGYSRRKAIERQHQSFQKGAPIEGLVEAFDEVLNYLKNQYPAMWDSLDRMRKLGTMIINRGYRMKLPNGFPVALDLDRPYSLPSHVMQANVSILTTDLFLELHKMEYNPLFDIHDSVITSKQVDFDLANQILRTSVEKFINLYKLDWKVPESAQLVTIEKLFFDPSLSGYQSMGEGYNKSA